MSEVEARRIPIEELLLDLNNPRYPALSDQRTALSNIVTSQGMKLVRLAEDIVERGLNPSKRALVLRENGGFIALEGNRRLAALKLLTQKELRSTIGLTQAMERRFVQLYDRAVAAGALPASIDCVVTTREDAGHWIHLEHTGENEGVGVVSWDGASAQRFRGGSPSTQAVDLVTPYLDEKVQQLLPRISITNVERLLNTPEARKALGVQINKRVLSLEEPQDISRARLAAAITDIAKGTIKVTDLDSSAQRKTYANKVAARPLRPLTAPAKPGSAPATAPATKKPRREAVQRITLIPRTFPLSIKQARLNKIYDELCHLSAKKFPNSAAVLLRVFVELSIDEYGAKHHVSMKEPPKPGAPAGSKSKDLTLRKKILTAAKSLEDRGVRDKNQLKGMRTIVSNRDHPLSVDSLNAYVHNANYSPALKELTLTWDNIQPFISGLWA